ncbi:MAG TPA: DoxX family membrane protein [Myxococcales bacterium]|nr:DoxX family membrane protein [Myxococcales bacterium]
MTSRGFFAFLGLLRIAAGVSLFMSGLQKLAWFGSAAALDTKLADWAQHPANSLVTKYLAWLAPHSGLFARLVVLGELGLGALLAAGFLTPLVALLAFLMVASFQFAGSSMFSLNYLRGQSGLAYLLIYPVLMLGRAGTSLGLDGIISRSGRKAQPSA